MAARAHLIVFANEKGGSGKSTTAVHIAVAVAAAGRKVAGIDLDTRQRTFARYMENRAATMQRETLSLPMPAFETFDPTRNADIERRLDELLAEFDVVVADTPGRDDPYAREVISRADTLVTPVNDSFVDLDLIGQVDANSFKVSRPSFYAEVVWDARKNRGKRDGATVDWVVLRNRLQHIEARNMKRVQAALDELAKRVGFRVIPGLSERVVYRELFPKGLTLIDLQAIGDTAISHIAARQELRDMLAGLQLPAWPRAIGAPDEPVAVETAAE